MRKPIKIRRAVHRMEARELLRQAALPKCQRCGRPATAVHVDLRTPGITMRTQWCDTCAPGPWEITARQRRLASARWTANEPRPCPYG
jgi:recombinational DNA repair protein (RecF pathway)